LLQRVITGNSRLNEQYVEMISKLVGRSDRGLFIEMLDSLIPEPTMLTQFSFLNLKWTISQLYDATLDNQAFSDLPRIAKIAKLA